MNIDGKAKLKWRIADRGWTYDHVVAMCAFCRKCRDLAAGEHHTGYFLSNVIDGYFRGIYGLEKNNYRFISDVQIRPEDVDRWSVAALKAKKENLKSILIIEHGSPKRDFSRFVYRHYLNNTLTKELLDTLIKTHYKIAVVTKGEHSQLSSIGARNIMLQSSEARWAAAGIEFPT